MRVHFPLWALIYSEIRDIYMYSLNLILSWLSKIFVCPKCYLSLSWEEGQAWSTQDLLMVYSVFFFHSLFISFVFLHKLFMSQIRDETRKVCKVVRTPWIDWIAIYIYNALTLLNIQQGIYVYDSLIKKCSYELLEYVNMYAVYIYATYYDWLVCQWFSRSEIEILEHLFSVN